MRKLKPLLLVILFLVMGTYGCATIQKQSSEDQFRWVAAKRGLSVRNAPSSSGKKIDVVAFGTRVLLLSEKEESIELAGKVGRWTEVYWAGNTGWVFGGFLTNNKIDQQGQPQK